MPTKSFAMACVAVLLATGAAAQAPAPGVAPAVGTGGAVARRPVPGGAVERSATVRPAAVPDTPVGAAPAGTPTLPPVAAASPPVPGTSVNGDGSAVAAGTPGTAGVPPRQ